MLTPDTYIPLVSSFADLKILVIGDFILDQYLHGTSTRLSPEAPVPVVDISDRKQFAGGAGNTAANLASLGATVRLCTVVGEDPEGKDALALLLAMDIEVAGVVVDRRRKTIVKTRVVADGHVMIRYDSGDERSVCSETADAVVNALHQHAAWCDAIVISDYNKGLITAPVLQEISKARKRCNKFVAVDSKRLSFFKELAPDLVKPNYSEAMRLLNVEAPDKNRLLHIERMSYVLATSTEASIIALTLDAEGSIIIEKGELIHHALAPKVQTPQVNGAGDTYLSAFTLSYLVTSDSRVAAEIATAAATVAVRKSSTACCTQRELLSFFDIKEKYVSSSEDILELCERYRLQGKRIVFTNGCFDILHSGHVTYLQQASALGDVLIVGLNNDESIRRLKGEQRPINSFQERLLVLAALSSVNHIIGFGNAEDDTPTELIRAIRPAVFVKGGDYARENLPEASAIEAVGGEIVLIPRVPNRSTTNIITRIARPSDIAAHG